MNRMIWTLFVAWLSGLWVGPPEVLSQVTPPPSISQAEYEALEWEEGVSLAQLLPLEGSWTALKQWLGEPTTEVCETEPVIGSVFCEVNWDGIEAEFLDDGWHWYIRKFEIKSAEHTLQMEGVQIGIGTSIHDLAPLLPVPYDQRRVRCVDECLYRVEFTVLPFELIVNFVYDPESEKITRIQFREHWS